LSCTQAVLANTKALISLADQQTQTVGSWAHHRSDLFSLCAQVGKNKEVMLLESRVHEAERANEDEKYEGKSIIYIYTVGV